MEKHGIGTDASIPTHIANIINREYCRVDENTRVIKPTPLGLLLGHGYHKIDPDLVLPELRAYMEENMKSIADGHTRKDEVIFHVLRIFKAKFEYFVRKFDKMDDMFDQFYNNPKTYKGNKRLSKCGFCRRDMKFIKQRGPPKLYCDQCDCVYRLPLGLQFKNTQQLCPICNFEIIKYADANKTNDEILRSHPICPYCYSYPPTLYPDPDRPTKNTVKKRKRGKKKTGADGENGNSNETGDNGLVSTGLSNLAIAGVEKQEWNEINIENMPKLMSCNHCWNKGCSLSARHFWLKPCPNCNYFGRRDNDNTNNNNNNNNYGRYDNYGNNNGAVTTTNEANGANDANDDGSNENDETKAPNEDKDDLPPPGTKYVYAVDPLSGPDKWRICCSNTRCNNEIQITTHTTRMFFLFFFCPECLYVLYILVGC